MTTVFLIIEILGVIAFSISGAMTAIDHENDLFGVIFVAVITTFGGGITRDLIIGNTIPVFFRDITLGAICIFSAVSVFILAAIFKKPFLKNEKRISQIANVFDAAGLGAFVVAGTKISMSLGYSSAFVAITMGFISGCFGSLIRDLCMQKIPAILRKHVYAVAALSGAACYWLMVYLGANEAAALIVSPILVFVIRMCATFFKWNFPKAIDFSKIERE